MQGWLLEEMNKFTKIGVVTPKYQIQNNFPNKEIWLKKKKNLKSPPHSFSPMNRKLLQQANQRIQSHKTGIFFKLQYRRKTLKTNYINKTLI